MSEPSALAALRTALFGVALLRVVEVGMLGADRREDLDVDEVEFEPGAPKPSLLIEVEHWRQRAEGARVTAEMLKDPGAKRAMTGIAAGYDRLVESAEWYLEHSNPPAKIEPPPVT